MGRNKLILPWGKRTVFEHCLDVLLRSEVEEVVVVLGRRKGELEALIKRYLSFTKRVRVVVNPDSREGMSSSIRVGLRSVHPASRGVLIALGDQPLLRARTINALIHAFIRGKEKIAVPFYHNKRGNPVLFGRAYIRDLLTMRGDRGGRSILEAHPEEILRVRTRSEGIVRDIDTWREYGKLKKRALR
jgi:molybdenum cofactor cytidylyltransferase